MLKLPEKYRDLEVLLRRLILFALAVGLLVIYFPQLLGFLGAAIWVCLPFIIGGLLAYILNIVSNQLMRFARYVLHIKNPRKHEIWFKLLTTLVVAALVGIFIFVIGPMLLDSAERVISNIPDMVDRLIDMAYKLGDRIPVIKNWLNTNSDKLTDLPAMAQNILSFVTTGGAGETFNSLKSVITNAMSWTWVFLLSFVFAFIAFFNTRQLIRETNLIARAYLPEKIYKSIVHIIGIINRIFSQYIGGTLLECLILATLVSVGGLIFQIPNAVLVGAVCGLCALVPMFGATASAIVCTLFMMADSPAKAITFLIMFICIQQVEGNFIYPNVVGKSVGLPPMFVVVAITIGGAICGVLGMIISIPIASFLYEIIIEHAKGRLDAKELAELTHPGGEVDKKQKSSDPE